MQLCSCYFFVTLLVGVVRLRCYCDKWRDCHMALFVFLFCSICVNETPKIKENTNISEAPVRNGGTFGFGAREAASGKPGAMHLQCPRSKRVYTQTVHRKGGQFYDKIPTEAPVRNGGTFGFGAREAASGKPGKV